MIGRKVGFYVISLLLLSALRSPAQTAQVTGEVLRKDGHPAVNYTVSIADKFAFTDVRGRFRVLDVPYGEHDLRVTRDKRVIKEIKVKISQPQTVIPPIRLPE